MASHSSSSSSSSSTIMEEAKTSVDAFPYKHEPTPLHPKKAKNSGNETFSVLCNKCRPSSCDKLSIVHFDTSMKSPGKLQSLFLSITRSGRSPKPSPSPSPTPSGSGSGDGQYWKVAAAELSRKLIHANRKRDEALLEVSRLKHSVADLEVKLTKVESDCLDIRSSLECKLPSFPADDFTSTVSSARSAVRALARTSRGSSPLVHVEALLNRILYDDFEKWDECSVLDPVGLCAANRAAYKLVQGITWEEVLTKGTRHYSEKLSKFCDGKMSEVVGTLGWARAWPESLLRAFFDAAKGVWMVRLLAQCVHPAVPVMRVSSGARFDGAYMEDAVVGEKVRRLTPVNVRMMVAPGFYVYSGGGRVGVVKCKVLCVYNTAAVESESSK